MLTQPAPEGLDSCCVQQSGGFYKEEECGYFRFSSDSVLWGLPVASALDGAKGLTYYKNTTGASVGQALTQGCCPHTDAGVALFLG